MEFHNFAALKTFKLITTLNLWLCF